jgi:mono/diheme cytochrome c family protein
LPEAPAADGGIVSFSADVLPILERRCVKCHGGEKTEDGLRLTNHAEVLAGSWNGPVIEPGNAADSYLIEQVESGEMPKNEPRLLPAEIRTLTDWVMAGAPDN